MWYKGACRSIKGQFGTLSSSFYLQQTLSFLIPIESSAAIFCKTLELLVVIQYHTVLSTILEAIQTPKGHFSARRSAELRRLRRLSSNHIVLTASLCLVDSQDAISRAITALLHPIMAPPTLLHLSMARPITLPLTMAHLTECQREISRAIMPLLHLTAARLTKLHLTMAHLNESQHAISRASMAPLHLILAHHAILRLTMAHLTTLRLSAALPAVAYLKTIYPAMIQGLPPTTAAITANLEISFPSVAFLRLTICQRTRPTAAAIIANPGISFRPSVAFPRPTVLRLAIRRRTPPTAAITAAMAMPQLTEFQVATIILTC